MVIERTESGITTKLLVALGREAAEVVAVRRPTKNIVCFSTQVGCAMGCRFCVSGAIPFARNLTVAEMRMLVEAALAHCAPSNPLVLSAMGEGEPALNAEAVVATLASFHAAGAAPKLALSTVGPSPARLAGLVRAIAGSGLPIKTQFSLHAARHEVRRGLVKASRLSPAEALAILVGAVAPLELNVVLLDGINDGADDAEALVALVSDLDPAGYLLKFNAFNPGDAIPYRPSRRDRREAFLERIAAAGLPFETYETDGAEIQAACGQLHHRFVVDRLAGRGDATGGVVQSIPGS